MVWSEMNFAERTWEIPGERTKNGKPLKVPLSDAALAVLKAMPRDTVGDWVFPGLKAGVPLSNMATAAVLKRMEREDITVHGMRSAFSD
jgi:integrase